MDLSPAGVLLLFLVGLGVGAAAARLVAPHRGCVRESDYTAQVARKLAQVEDRLQAQIRELDQSVAQGLLREPQAQAAAAPPDPYPEFARLLLSQQQQLHERLLLCLDPLRLREAKNLQLQEARMEAEIEEVRLARAGRQEQEAGEAADRRARMAAALAKAQGARLGRDPRNAQAALEEEEEGPVAEPDPEAGDLAVPPSRRAQVDLRWTRPAPRPRQTMGRPAAARRPETARDVEQALGAAVVVGAEELQRPGGLGAQEQVGLDPELLPEPEEEPDETPLVGPGTTRAAG